VNKAIQSYLNSGINPTILPSNHRTAILQLYRIAEEFLAQKEHYLILQLGEITELSKSLQVALASQDSTQSIEFIGGAITLYNLLSNIALLLAQYEIEDAQKR
jgi:hypothetical protein